MSKHGVVGNWTAQSLAAHTQAVLQGAFILTNERQARVVDLRFLRRAHP